MSAKRAYTYVPLRYRHDPLMEETINVGILLYDSFSGYLGIKVRHTLGRLTRVFPDLNGEALKASLRSIEQGVKSLANASGGLLAPLEDAGSVARRVLPDDDTSFIWGAVGSGVAGEPSEALEALYQRLVARYDDRQHRHRDDEDVWRPVRDRLAERNISHCLQAKVIVSAYDRVEFQHAWKNGAWHCYQPLSFDLATGETIREKARRWVGQMVAVHGASEPFKPFFLVGAPADPGLGEAYQAAVSILKLCPGDPQVFDETEVDDLVDQIENEIRTIE
jgi:hypothetical protein